MNRRGRRGGKRAVFRKGQMAARMRWYHDEPRPLRQPRDAAGACISPGMISTRKTFLYVLLALGVAAGLWPFIANLGENGMDDRYKTLRELNPAPADIYEAYWVPRERQRYLLLVLNKSDSLVAWVRPGRPAYVVDDAGTIVDSSRHDSDDAVFFKQWEEREKTALTPAELTAALDRASPRP